MIRLFLFINLIFASSQIPASQQERPIVIKDATIFTISSGIIEKGSLRFKDGVITDIGTNIFILEEDSVINAEGKQVFPGLISSGSTLGLQEIGAVRATRDYEEVGMFNPNVRSNASYNPDSELIPVSRSNGILLALSIPRSGRISGTSSLMMLDGWTWEDATFKHPVGVHLFWPNMDKPSKKERKKKTNKNQKEHRIVAIEELDKFIKTARSYKQLKENLSSSYKHNLRLDAMLPVLNGDIPFFIHANSVSQIESAIYWSERQNLRIIIVGGKDSWRLTDLLVSKGISIIYTQTLTTPHRRFEDFDQSYKTPFQLLKAGVQFCISNSESPFQTPHLRNLPYHASKAASYGLPWDEALRSITLSAAEILGVDNKLGSLEVGKHATLFISDGNILDIRANVEMAFINGRAIDLSDRHKLLYEKYRQKY